MSRCTYCKSFVSRNFVRVFGDHDGRVYACPNCSANEGISVMSAQRKSTSL